MIRILLVILSFSSVSVKGAIDAYPFPNEELEARYQMLIAELRCPQCLNTNIAGSDAMISRDLRREVHRLLLEGKSDDEILDFMQSRYGDFILYDPQLKGGTLLLWFGPLAILIAGLLFVIGFVRSRRHHAPALSDAELSRLDELTK